MIPIVRRGEHLALVHAVDFDGLEHLGLREMADAAFCHDRDGHGLLDALDHFGIAHAGHAARRPDIRRDAFERHDRAGTGGFGDFGLLRGGDIHNDPALEHLAELSVQFHAIVFHTNRSFLGPSRRGGRKRPIQFITFSVYHCNCMESIV